MYSYSYNSDVYVPYSKALNVGLVCVKVSVKFIINRYIINIKGQKNIVTKQYIWKMRDSKSKT